MSPRRNNAGRSKRAKFGVEPEPVKKVPPGYLGQPNLEDLHVAWRFSNADLNGPFPCDRTDEELKDLISKLAQFERMSFDQLRRAKNYHRHPVDGLHRTARSRLQEIEQGDVDEICSFHVAGAPRLWCIRYENIMSVLWWDREHLAYPTPKR